MSRVEKLVMEVEPLVGVGELVRSAFLVQRGASPGMEGVASAFAGVLGMFAVMGSRRWYTFVVTDRNVYLLKNRRMNAPVAVETVAPLGSLGAVTGSGDYRLEFQSILYTVPLPWLDEARRAQRLNLTPGL